MKYTVWLHHLDFFLPGVVLTVQLAVQLGNVCDPRLVVLLLLLLQRPDLIFPGWDIAFINLKLFL